MKNLILFLLLVVTWNVAATYAACPDICRCISNGGQVIADCSKRSLTTVPTFAADDHITELYLQGNSIVELQSGSFVNLTSLRHLYLQENQIALIADDSFASMTSLVTLELTDNQITSLGNGIFTGLQSLQLLYLQNNAIPMIESGTFDGLSQVLEISLSGNEALTVLDPNAFCSLSTLSKLDISKHSIPLLSSQTFSCISNLQVLYLNLPNILTCDSTLKPFKEWAASEGSPLANQALIRCTQPEYMNGLSLNRITTVNLVSTTSCPSTCACFSNVVDCSMKGLDHFPDDISPNTIELHLQNNTLQQLDSNQFVHLPQLKMLNLQYNQISSIEADTFRNLNNLEILNINDNQIAAIPQSSFDDLSQLLILNLQNNNLKTLFQNIFQNMTTSIQEISLSGNVQLKHLSSEIFCQLWSLSRLDLSETSLPSYAPEMFSCITNLQYLYINKPLILMCDDTLKPFKQWADGDASKLPTQRNMECTEPVNMVGLNLATISTVNLVGDDSCPTNCSCFSHIVDCAWLNHESLPEDIPSTTKELFLQYNKLSQLSINQFAHLPNLQFLHLQFNDITEISMNAFSNLNNLQILNINDNKITDLRADLLADMTSLQVLNIQNNQIERLNQAMFNGLVNLKELSMSGNVLSSVATSTFCELNSLNNLDLSQNSLPTFQVDMFDCITSLQQLYLNDPKQLNCDGDLKDFKQWADGADAKLLAQDKVTCVSPSYMRGLPLDGITSSNLVSSGSCPATCTCFSQIVDCADRGLTSVPEDISPDTKELFLQSNSIEKLDENQFAHLPTLEHLYLQRNNISSMTSSSISSGMTSLKTLTLNENNLGAIPAGAFTGLGEISVLILNENKLQSLPETLFSDVTKLVELGLFGNEIGQVSKATFQGLSEIKYLGLGENQLAEVDDFLGEDFTDAYLVDYSFNHLTQIPKPPANLRQLYVIGNPISKVEAGRFERATDLYGFFATDCEIAEISEGAWMGADNLGWIMLENNHLTSIETHTFDNLNHLQAVFLTGNSNLKTVANDSLSWSWGTLQRLLLDSCGLEQLDGSFLQQFTNDDFYLWLAGNPWNCDCQLEELSEFITGNQDRVADVTGVTCSSPDEVKGQLVSDASSYEECHNTPQTTNPSPTSYNPTTITKSTTPATTPKTEPTEPVTTPKTTTPSDDGGDADNDNDEDVNSALIISLPIVGAILLFFLMSLFVYKKGSKAGEQVLDLDMESSESSSAAAKYSGELNTSKNTNKNTRC